MPVGEVAAELGRVSRQGAAGGLSAQLAGFAVVGVLSTLAFAVLYLGLRGPLGAQGANVVALLLTTVANTAANRRFTFGVRGPGGAAVHQLQGLVVLGTGIAVTSGALALLHQLAGTQHRGLEVVVLTAANLIVTVGRFVLMRGWMFRRGAARTG